MDIQAIHITSYVTGNSSLQRVKVVSESDVKPTEYIIQQAIILFRQFCNNQYHKHEERHILPLQEPPHMCTRKNVQQNMAQHQEGANSRCNNKTIISVGFNHESTIKTKIRKLYKMFFFCECLKFICTLQSYLFSHIGFC